MAGELENQRITRLTPLDDVLASIRTSVAPVAPRNVGLAGALGRALAEDVAAAAGQPGEARALRDGYAVRADDIADAGSYAPIPLAAPPVRVDVGDALPPGTDAVVPLDAIVIRGARAEVVATAAIGDGVLSIGADLRAGEFIARNGWRLNDFNLAMLAMAGRKQALLREPHIQLIKARVDADAVLDAASDLIARALNARGCAVRRSAGDLAAALADASIDAVIVLGGTGSGRNDTSVQALARHGRVVAHGIAISPGETSAFGMCGSRPALLLPGRIDAAIAGWLTIGLPMCDRLSASSDGSGPSTVAKLARKVASPIGLVEVVPVRLTRGVAEPIASGYWPLGSLAGTDGWVLVPANSEGFPAGSEVVIKPWP
jgi:molybdopterin biosynthesis enzyme